MDSRKPHAPLSDSNTAKNAASGQHRIGWYMVGGGVFVIIAMVFWLSKLQRQSPPVVAESEENKEAVLEPDGPYKPGPKVGVAFADEMCIPWHVSAASNIPPADSRFIILTSTLVDPYAYTATGFKKDCGARIKKILVVEDLRPGRLDAVVSEINPSAIVAVGEASADMVRKKLPGQRMLYAMVQAPGKSGMDQAGYAGVIPAVAVAVAVRRMIDTLPRKAKKIGVIYAKEKFSSLAKDALSEISSLERTGVDIGLDASGDIVPFREKVLQCEALVVLIDGGTIDDESLGKILVLAEHEKIPVCVSDERHVMQGAYVGIGVDSYRIGRQLCHLAGAMVRDELPEKGGVYCPEYSFAVLNNAIMEKLGYILGPEQLRQVKLYKWK